MTKVSLTPIQQRIAGMLTENTGMHMLDSGGAYGRNWQRNQGKDFTKESQVKVEVYENDVTFSRSTFDFLTSQCDVTPASEKLNSQFKAFLNTPEIKEGDAPDWSSETMQAFMDKLFKGQERIVDIYGEEDGQIGKVDNSYNYDNALDQVLLTVMFRKDGKTFVLLSVHGGADVRGGYTTPQVFEVTSDEGVADWIGGMQDLYAADGDNGWNSDDAGYHWYGQMGDAKDLDGDVTKQWTLDKAKQKVFSKLNGKEVSFSA
jgi:hypothetical protein